MSENSFISFSHVKDLKRAMSPILSITAFKIYAVEPLLSGHPRKLASGHLIGVGKMPGTTNKRYFI